MRSDKTRKTRLVTYSLYLKVQLKGGGEGFNSNKLLNLASFRVKFDQ